MDPFLSGKRALVVGGSGGIGAATSLELARAGASLLVHGGHDERRLQRTAAAAAQLGAHVETKLLAFVRASDALALLQGSPSPEILVVSFGPYLDAPIHETDGEAIRFLVEMNLLLPMLLVRAVLPAMRENHYGRIILFGAPRGDRIEGYRRIGVYASAKMGVGSLARSIARQYAGDNIRCYVLCPGYVATEYYSAGQAAELAAARPALRLVAPEEIARSAVDLLRPERDAVNGAIIPIDFGE